jgi:hypothetical protein
MIFRKYRIKRLQRMGYGRLMRVTFQFLLGQFLEAEQLVP